MNLTGRQADLGTTWYKNTAGDATLARLVYIGKYCTSFFARIFASSSNQGNRRGTDLHA